ncbi:uncharacterized protein LOC122650491 [Telopea speciosissima]|uniref:uncharacterized protein LOC122650491 n=1 Tax=Telopea speciosissima TaxID=54955 RepID=UPI001CC3E9B2|nr:uncharacterized protein LOC122650491 [Telopea speciosissima]
MLKGLPLCLVHQRLPHCRWSTNPLHFSQVIRSDNPSALLFLRKAGNLQVASELRAPAPHLQPFRHSTSMPAPNIQPVPHTIPSQQALGNAASTSSMLPQLASRAPTLSSGPFSRSQQQESAVGLAGFSNSSLSALELLQPLPDLGLTVGALDPSELTTHCSSRGTAARTDPTADVVCISDDE